MQRAAQLLSFISNIVKWRDGQHDAGLFADAKLSRLVANKFRGERRLPYEKKHSSKCLMGPRPRGLMWTTQKAHVAIVGA